MTETVAPRGSATLTKEDLKMYIESINPTL